MEANRDSQTSAIRLPPKPELIWAMGSASTRTECIVQVAEIAEIAQITHQSSFHFICGGSVFLFFLESLGQMLSWTQGSNHPWAFSCDGLSRKDTSALPLDSCDIVCYDCEVDVVLPSPLTVVDAVRVVLANEAEVNQISFARPFLFY